VLEAEAGGFVASIFILILILTVSFGRIKDEYISFLLLLQCEKRLCCLQSPELCAFKSTRTSRTDMRKSALTQACSQQALLTLSSPCTIQKLEKPQAVITNNDASISSDIAGSRDIWR
jgi:hypothetical protein